MNGIARIAVGYFAMHRIQRVLAVFGLALAAIAATVRAAGGPGEGLLVAGLMLFQVPGLAIAAILVRQLSASRAYQLVPHLRLRLLVSLLLAVAGTALVWPLAFLGWGTASGLPSIIIGVVSAGSASAFVLATFVVSESRARTAGAGLCISIVGAVGPSAVRAMARTVDPHALIAPIAIATACAWLVFALWYVRAPRIAGAWSRLGWPLEPGPSTVATTSPSPALAVASVLSGTWIEREPWRDPKLLLALVGLLGVTWFVMGTMPPRLIDTALVGVVAPAPFLGWMMAAHFVRRSRLLWLAGGSRAALFHVCEGRSLRVMAATTLGIGTFFVALLPHLTVGVRPVDVVWLPALLAASATCGMYLGLMNITGWRVLDVALGVAIFAVPFAGYETAIGMTPTPAIVPLTAVTLQIAIAVACRLIAVRRWLQIDWLRLRPLPWLGQATLRTRVGR